MQGPDKSEEGMGGGKGVRGFDMTERSYAVQEDGQETDRRTDGPA